MILWFTIAIIAVCVIQAVYSIIAGLIGKVPGDATIGLTALIELLLIVQIVMCIIGPFAGNHAKGDPLEFWSYLISAAFIPIGAVAWAFSDRTKWSNVVLGAGGIAVGVMAYRMWVIWTTIGA